jgi:WD40 repeat protein
MVTGSSDCTVKLWNLLSKTLISILNEGKNELRSAIFSPDLKILASTSTNYSISLWDM